MAAEVQTLGYTVISATDLDAWERFAVDLLGLQVAERTPDRLRLRMDDKAYRLDVRKDTRDGVSTLGWEVASADDLEEIVGRLEAGGYAVTREDPEFAKRERLVTEVVSFTDPDGVRIEIFYGFKSDKGRFVSPTGATFLTGEGGLGHVFQLVNDNKPYEKLYFDILGFKLSDYIEFGPLDATFTHCNPRHHSFAFAAIPNVPAHVGHIMLEVDDIDVVGRAYHKVLYENAAPLALSFGRHSNDQMQSFYVNTPSGFQIEYGTGGLLIDDATWRPSRYDVPSVWGHVRQPQPA